MTSCRSNLVWPTIVPPPTTDWPASHQRHKSSTEHRKRRVMVLLRPNRWYWTIHIQTLVSKRRRRSADEPGVYHPGPPSKWTQPKTSFIELSLCHNHMAAASSSRKLPYVVSHSSPLSLVLVQHKHSDLNAYGSCCFSPVHVDNRAQRQTSKVTLTATDDCFEHATALDNCHLVLRAALCRDTSNNTHGSRGRRSRSRFPPCVLREHSQQESVWRRAAQ